MGRSDLGGAGRNGDVAVVGTTAVVGAGLLASSASHTSFFSPIPCPNVAVKVVDLSNAATPTVAATIPLPAGVAAIDVDALRVATPSFTGDLAAIALQTCGVPGGNAEKGVHYYDVSKPASPVLLGRYQADADNVPPEAPPCSPTSTTGCAAWQHAVHLVQRADGRVLSLSTEPGATPANLPSGDLRIVDVTNPRSPTQVGSFPPLGLGLTAGGGFTSANGCRSFYSGHGAEASHDGTRAALAYLDEGVFTLNLANPAAPAALGRFEYPEERDLEAGAAQVTWADVAGRQLGL